MALRLEAVTFDVADARAAAAFWAGLLDRPALAEPGAVLVPGDGTQVGLRFVASDTAHVGPHRLHLHLTSSSPDQQRRTVAAALRLGGRHLDVGQGPEAPFVVLADPAGGELCVIEAGNAFLAGAGLLGEVTCDGSREVGLFWHDALGWPLVWDQDGQTAIRSPRGGTTISWDTWGDPEIRSGNARSRQRFDLVADDPAVEADRLVALGATRRTEGSAGVEMADPDGGVFRLRRA